jgi:pilus assembly protein Flp/PilA
MKTLMYNLWNDEEGATMIEYVLLAALIAIVALVGVKLVGNSANNKFNEVGTEIAK